MRLAEVFDRAASHRRLASRPRVDESELQHGERLRVDVELPVASLARDAEVSDGLVHRVR